MRKVRHAAETVADHLLAEFENDRSKETDRLRRLLASAEDDKRDFEHKIDILQQVNSERYLQCTKLAHHCTSES